MNVGPLIPRRALFGNPDRASVQVSPDGHYISYLSSLDGVLNVFVAPAADASSAQAVTRDRGRGVHMYLWAHTSQHVLWIQDEDGNENFRLYGVDVATGEARCLTPVEGAQVQLQHVSPKFPAEILIRLNNRVPELHDVYRVNLRTGEQTLIERNDQGFLSYVSDDEYRVRMALRLNPDGVMTWFMRGGSDFEVMTEVPHEDSLTTSPHGFDKSGQGLYIEDSRGRDTAALYRVDLSTGHRTPIAEDPRADLGDYLLHPTEKTVQAVSFTYDRKRWQFFDSAVAADFEYLATVCPGEVEVTSRTLDDAVWMVAFTLDDGPVRYYHYDRRKRTARFLFTNRLALENQPLRKMHSVVIEARDGLPLVSYVTLPRDSDTNQPGRPDAPLPLVLLVHGGPWYRDHWGYNPLHQWLANRGYAVLSVNFRASSGFGKDFTNAGDLEWGRKMHDDLIDAVDWAVKEGIAARDRVAIMGGSYGGYATLWGMTRTPDRFACGVDIVGPSSLITLIESIPPYWEPMIALFRKRMGDNTREAGRELLLERSPLRYAGEIRRPLLIAQGANDPRVKQAESDQIVHAMQSKQIPVTYALYPDEGHGFARPENNLSFTAITEAFLSTHLGGACEPIGDDFTGSSVTIPAGLENIPGVRESLSTR